VDLVVLDAEVGDAGTLALRGFELQQKGVAVLGDAAKLVELGIEPRDDDAAIAQQRRRLLRQGCGERLMDLGGGAMAPSSRSSSSAVPSEPVPAGRAGPAASAAARRARAAGPGAVPPGR
jgi:hypothetical protein